MSDLNRKESNRLRREIDRANKLAKKFTGDGTRSPRKPPRRKK